MSVGPPLAPPPQLGPRMTLQLVKIEEGFCEGEVLHHAFSEWSCDSHVTSAPSNNLSPKGTVASVPFGTTWLPLINSVFSLVHVALHAHGSVANQPQAPCAQACRACSQDPVLAGRGLCIGWCSHDFPARSSNALPNSLPTWDSVLQPIKWWSARG